jgi:hypothetical protein
MLRAGMRVYTMGRVGGAKPASRVRRATLVLVLAGGVAVSGCTSGGNVFNSSDPSPGQASTNTSTSGNRTSFSDRMNAFFFGNPSTTGQTTAAAEIDCPSMDIRAGASTYAVSAPGAEANATNLRYQATIARAARECAALGATLTIKVGVQGRILLGPAGGPGQIDIPMRLALVEEGLQPKTIWTKFYRVPVAIPPGQTSVTFVQIEEDLTVPMPRPADLEAYVIYVGFDPAGAKEPERKRPPAKKPQASR